jgi:hypothetical protein
LPLVPTNAETCENLIKVIVLETTVMRSCVRLDASGSGALQLAKIVIHKQSPLLGANMIQASPAADLFDEARLPLQTNRLTHNRAIEQLSKTCGLQSGQDGGLAAFRNNSQDQACFPQGLQARSKQGCSLSELHLLSTPLSPITRRGSESTIKVKKHSTNIARYKFQVAPIWERCTRRQQPS